MENKPKKSRAFLITFILVLIILLVGYLLLKNKDGIFRINNGEKANKEFESLTETKEIKDLGYIDVDATNECISISVIAGEDVFKGEAVYVSQIAQSGEPIVMKAIANDETKSRVVGVAMTNILTGTNGMIANNCIVTGLNTDRNEGTVWKIGDNLYLSDTTPGALTKNAPSNKIIIGSVKTISAIDGSIKVGGAGTNVFDISEAIQEAGINTKQGINYAIDKLKQLFGNIFGYEYGGGEFDANGLGEWVWDEDYNGFVWKWKGTGPDFNGPDFPDFGFTRACNNEKDDDADGLTDEDDPQCHINGDLTKQYVPTHYSESINAIDPNGPDDDLFACNNKGDDDGDELIDENDPQCHIDGILTNKYIPTHYSEEINAIDPDRKSYICSNTEDDDKDELTDMNDPQCHVGGILTNEYVPTHYSESINAPDPNPDVIPTPDDICENGALNYPDCTEFPDGVFVCNNKYDDDKDSKIDSDDPQCHIDGDLEKEYVPDHTSESINAKAECSNGKDDDDDFKIDKFDPECYTGGNINTGTYLPSHNSEKNAPSEEIADMCKVFYSNPLVFTDSEQAELDKLLKKFYIMAPKLRNEDDISSVYNQVDKYLAFNEQIDELTNQCYTQKNDKFNYRGPTTVYGNPWYKYTERGSYLNPYLGSGETPLTSQSTSQDVIAGENIKSGDFVYAVDTKDGLSVVKKYTQGIELCGGSLGICIPAIAMGIASGDINTGQTGKITLFNFSMQAMTDLNLGLDQLNCMLSVFNSSEDDKNHCANVLRTDLVHDLIILLNIW